MTAGNRDESGNRLLDLLPREDYERLFPALELLKVELKQVLFEPGHRIDSVYFPVTSVGSLVTLMHDSNPVSAVEIATTGNEGLLGVTLAIGAEWTNPRERIQVQMPGEVLRMDAAPFVAELRAGGTLTRVVQRYSQAFVSQISQQVACNGLHTIEERCARWLLLMHDRVGVDEFPLTQEFLAEMLGVRRPSVTVVAGVLQQAGFIRFRRGRLSIYDREGLEGSACECYAVIREVFDRLLQ